MIKAIRITAPILLVLWMLLIFSLSAQNAAESSNTSGGLIYNCLSLIYPDFESLSQAEQLQLIGSMQFYVRKMAHFTIYAILGCFSYLSFVTYNNLKLSLRMALSLAVCLLYSVSDEIHQNFVAGRSCEFRDIIIDFSGSLIAVLFLFLITNIIIVRRKRAWKLK